MANIAVKNAIDGLGIGPKASIILEAHFDNPTLTQKQLAEKMGISQARVSAILRHPRVIKAFPGIARQRIKSALPRATAKLVELMDQTTNLEVSRKSTFKILENEKVLDNTQTFVHKNQFELMRPEELNDILNRAKAIGNPVIDAEIVENEAK